MQYEWIQCAQLSNSLIEYSTTPGNTRQRERMKSTIKLKTKAHTTKASAEPKAKWSHYWKCIRESKNKTPVWSLPFWCLPESCVLLSFGCCYWPLCSTMFSKLHFELGAFVLLGFGRKWQPLRHLTISLACLYSHYLLLSPSSLRIYGFGFNCDGKCQSAAQNFRREANRKKQTQKKINTKHI